jgi:hypothetical protein
MPWPVPDLNTYDGVVADIVRHLDDRGRAALRSMPREDVILLHHGWGTAIRNRYGFWHNGALLRSCTTARFGSDFPFPIHPDDASGIVMEGVWDAVNGRLTASTAPVAR